MQATLYGFWRVNSLKKDLTVLILITICVSIFIPYTIHADEFPDDEPFVGALNAKDGSSIKMPVIDAASAIVMDSVTGRVLFEKNAYTKRPMASTTKIMTAIIALEHGNLEDVVTVSKRAASVGGSVINLKAGEKLKLIELLYGLMMKSGNDAAIAIAEHVGGSYDNFIAMMNKKAALLGAKNTQFKTPHGLDANGHYSTAYDMAVITRYAIKNPTFSRIVSTKSRQIPSRGLYNTNEMLGLYPGADGVKTGYTGLAGRCLVTSATRDNWRIISVVLGCSSRTKRAQSSKSILDYAFANYKLHTLLKKGEQIGTLPVIKGIKGTVSVNATEGITFPLREDELKSIQKRVNMPDSISAPVYAGEDIGSIEYVLKGEVIAEVPLKVWNDVRRKDVIDYLKDILKAWSLMMREGIFN
jgi:D-alanyl-D-alanine carboxypeptidase (penicillin-binding protein 5/6)